MILDRGFENETSKTVGKERHYFFMLNLAIIGVALISTTHCLVEIKTAGRHEVIFLRP